MNANTKGTLFVKLGRCEDRVELLYKQFMREQNAKENDSISFEDFKDFVKAIHIILTTELNEKGVERKWKA